MSRLTAAGIARNFLARRPASRFNLRCMKMIPFILVFASSLILTGCDHLAPAGNATKFYQPFTGTQTDWPVSSSGSFVTAYKGVTIYHGLPPVPYTVMGRFDRPNIPLFRLVKCAKYYHADAIFMSEQAITEFQTQHGVTLGNNHIAITTPSTTRSVSATEATAYLIKTNAP